MKKSILFVLRIVGCVLYWITKRIVRSILYFDRNVLKRCFNLETPLYKLWWENNVKYVQKKLDERNMKLKTA